MSRWLAIFLAVLMSSAAAAEERPAEPPEQIGRLAALAGAVSYQADANAMPAAAIANYPLTTVNRIATRPLAHATLDIAAGRFYLDGDSALTIGALGPGTAVVAVEKGAVILHILPGGAGQVFVIETSRGRLRADQPGYFEVEVTQDGVVASTLEGGAQFDATVLPPGTRATLAEDQAKVLGPAVEDDFIRRVAAEVAESGDNTLAPPRHVSPQTTGFQDLQRYGLWIATEKYGWVWQPQVMSDWAPLREGHWVETARLGRVWIDDAPWGFAPSHYGRWIDVNGSWVWIPGKAALMSDAPAVASFFGTPDTNGQNAAHWVALGPEEPYFTPSPVIVNEVRVISRPAAPAVVNNVTTVNNTTNVTNVVKQDRSPAVVVFTPRAPVPAPTPRGGVPTNTTGLGASGTPIGAGVAFPGQR